MDNNITINLELVGSIYTMSCLRSEEHLYREAADLIKKEYQAWLEKFRNNPKVNEKDLAAFTLLALALRLKSMDEREIRNTEKLKSLDTDLSDFLK